MSKKKEILVKTEEVVIEVSLREEQIKHSLTLVGKSSKIRYFDSVGFSRKEISEILKIRYQHVRNVLVTTLKKDMK